jgi:hypothetical protein
MIVVLYLGKYDMYLMMFSKVVQHMHLSGLHLMLAFNLVIKK